MSVILGINAFHAGAAAALVIDGVPVVAIAEERLNRVKYHAGFIRTKMDVLVLDPYFCSFMQKEFTITVSRSYGSGRYDPDYEARGMKYPPGFVRWTETENLKASLDLMRLGRSLRLNPGAFTEEDAVFDNPDINAVLLATPHSLHARQTTRALNAGKYVFVEKPLASTREELQEVVVAACRSPAFFQVGFNRRFAPLSLATKEHLETLGGGTRITLESL